MKKSVLSTLLALLLLPALALPWAAALEQTPLKTDFSMLSIYAPDDTVFSLGSTQAQVRVVVVGRVTCGLTTNRVQVSQELMEQLHIDQGQICLLDIDQDKETVLNYAQKHPDLTVGWTDDRNTYNNLFWEITRAYYPDFGSGSATLPALAVLDKDCNVLYYVSGSDFERSTLEEILKPYAQEASQPEPSDPPSDPGTPSTPETPPATEPDPDPQPEPKPSVSFVDVSGSDYCYDAVQWAVSNGITSGTSSDRFSPNAACNRAQVVSFLWRAAGSPAPTGDATFTDVKSDDYFRDAVLWAVEKGITNGTGNGAFSPYTPVNRAQAVTFLHRYAGEPAASGATFADVPADAYYTVAVKWASATNVTNGIGVDTFGPNSGCTRGQVVTFLYRSVAK